MSERTPAQVVSLGDWLLSVWRTPRGEARRNEWALRTLVQAVLGNRDAVLLTRAPAPSSVATPGSPGTGFRGGLAIALAELRDAARGAAKPGFPYSKQEARKLLGGLLLPPLKSGKPITYRERKIREAIQLVMDAPRLCVDGSWIEATKDRRSKYLADEVLPEMARREGWPMPKEGWQFDSIARRNRKLRGRKRPK